MIEDDLKNLKWMRKSIPKAQAFLLSLDPNARKEDNIQITYLERRLKKPLSICPPFLACLYLAKLVRQAVSAPQALPTPRALLASRKFWFSLKSVLCFEEKSYKALSKCHLLFF